MYKRPLNQLETMKKSLGSIVAVLGIIIGLAILLFVAGCIKKVEFEPGTTVKVPATEVNADPTDTVTAKSDITTSTSDTVKLVPITNDVHILFVQYFRNQAGQVRIQLEPYVYLNGYYCRNALIQFKSAITADNHFNLHLINVRESQGCAVSTSPTSSVGLNTAAYDVFVHKYVGFGTYPLKITVGDVAYTGSITVTATNVTFNWPYKSGVVFTNSKL
jgi:hypothetical protein